MNKYNTYSFKNATEEEILHIIEMNKVKCKNHNDDLIKEIAQTNGKCVRCSGGRFYIVGKNTPEAISFILGHNRIESIEVNVYSKSILEVLKEIINAVESEEKCNVNKNRY